MNTDAIFKNGGYECRSRSRKYLVLKIYKQFHFTAAILLNGGGEGQINVRCETFDKFEIAIHLSIH